MPYSSIKDLPKGIRDNLPRPAQEIYVSAFNNALEEYKEKKDSEQIAHKVAWSAVKAKYEKHGDCWCRRQESDQKSNT